MLGIVAPDQHQAPPGIQGGDFDDGQPTYSETATSAPDGAFDGRTTHAYSTAGVFTVSLSVHDPAGNSATDTSVVTISSKPEATINSISPTPS